MLHSHPFGFGYDDDDEGNVYEHDAIYLIYKYATKLDCFFILFE